MIRILLKVFVTLLAAVAFTFIFLVMAILTFRHKELMEAIRQALDDFNVFWKEPV